MQQQLLRVPSAPQRGRHGVGRNRRRGARGGHVPNRPGSACAAGTPSLTRRARRLPCRRAQAIAQEAARDAQARQVFARMDKNGDGKIDPVRVALRTAAEQRAAACALSALRLRSAVLGASSAAPWPGRARAVGLRGWLPHAPPRGSSTGGGARLHAARPASNPAACLWSCASARSI
jgi:hypothetical protein